MKTASKYNNRPTLSNMYNVLCEDWGLSWGFSTTNIGRLYWNDEDKYFIYRGRNQGRHGQTWNVGKEIHFTWSEDEPINILWSNNKGSLPKFSEVKKSIELLNTLIKTK